jgi:hypothetical protein
VGRTKGKRLRGRPSCRWELLCLVLQFVFNNKFCCVPGKLFLYRFQNAFLHCPTPRLHCFLSSHWPLCRFLSFMAILVPSIQFFFRSSSCCLYFGIHFNAILCNLPSAIQANLPTLKHPYKSCKLCNLERLPFLTILLLNVSRQSFKLVYLMQ